MMDLSGFNKTQYQAITSTAPYIKVIAGAGSGKTAVLTNRIAYLVKQRNVSPLKILAITFTNKAANEMKERVLKLLQIDKFEGMVATFHSFCLRILKEDINLLGYSRNFNIIDGDDQKRIIKELNKTLNCDSNLFVPNSIIHYIASKKNDYECYYDDEVVEIYQKFYQEYQKYLQANDSVDFDDLILLVNKLFASNAQCLEKWRYRYHYLHVDEFQDINKAQYELIKYLGKDLNVFVVGDPDQNIYSWRGACIDYILNFETDFYPSEVIKLEYNYRSSSHILAVANSLIEHNDNRIDKVLKATITEENIKVQHFIGHTDLDEADYVVRTIFDVITNTAGVNYQDFAILYRANYISRVFETKLMEADIPYQVIGGLKFFERKEIKDLLAYLKVINNEDNLSLLRIINTPKRKLGDASINKVIKAAERLQVNYYQCLKNHLAEIGLSTTQCNNVRLFVNNIEELKKETAAPGYLLTQLAQRFDVISEYHHGSAEYTSRQENIQELINYAQSTNLDTNDFVQMISLDTTYEEGNDAYKVNLLSIHSAKGLEFKYVFVVYLMDGIFPSKHALSREGLEEERRLAYVAFTRAKKQLYLLSHTRGFDFSVYNSSIFLKEIEQELLEKDGVKQFDDYVLPAYDDVETASAEETNADYEVGEAVVHPKFHKGIIIAIDGEVLTIAFEHPHGIKYINQNFIRKV